MASEDGTAQKSHVRGTAAPFVFSLCMSDVLSLGKAGAGGQKE